MGSVCISALPTELQNAAYEADAAGNRNGSVGTSEMTPKLKKELQDLFSEESEKLKETPVTKDVRKLAFLNRNFAIEIPLDQLSEAATQYDRNGDGMVSSQEAYAKAGDVGFLKIVQMSRQRPDVVRHSVIGQIPCAVPLALQSPAPRAGFSLAGLSSQSRAKA